MVRRSMWGVLALVGLAAALSVSSVAAPKPKAVKWEKDLEKGLALAKKLNKPVLIDFYAEWDEGCEQMERDTLSDPKVIDLSRRFLMIKVKSDGSRRLMIRYGVRNFPTFILNSADGRELGRVTGYRPASSFTEEMNEVLRQLKVSR